MVIATETVWMMFHQMKTFRAGSGALPQVRDVPEGVHQLPELVMTVMVDTV